MNKLPLILLVSGATLCLISLGLQGYGDGQGLPMNTTSFTIIGVILVAIGAYLNSRQKKS